MNEAISDELRKLWEANDPLFFSVSSWMDLKQKYSGTSLGQLIDQVQDGDRAWKDLKYDMEMWNREHVAAQMEAYEAEEELEIRQRLGGYFASAYGLDKTENDELRGQPFSNHGRTAILNAIDSRIDRLLPSIDEVRERLGDDVAENYRADLEQLQNRGIAPVLATYPVAKSTNHSSASPTHFKAPRLKVIRKSCRSQELREMTQLVNVAAISDPDVRVEAYIHNIHTKKQSRSQQRLALKERNTWAIEKARSYNIWFCYAKDEPKWLADPSTCETAPVFIALVREARRKLANQRCILQYIPKRRLTRHASKQVLDNIKHLLVFLRRNDI